jgi:hypothetical protein
MKADKFDECSTCINKSLDPFRCWSCNGASNHETDEDDVEHLTYHEFIEQMKEEE